MDVNIEVLTPIWVLKNIVERDYEAWAMFNKPTVLVEDKRFNEWYDARLMETPAEPEEFPEYDSTWKALEILEKYNIKFDVDTGKWID